MSFFFHIYLSIYQKGLANDPILFLFVFYTASELFLNQGCY